MLYFQIKDYSEFKEIFGTCKSPRGTIQNKILLAFWKGRFKRNPKEPASKIRNMIDLYQFIMEQLQVGMCPTRSANTVRFSFDSKDYVFNSNKYRSASLSGYGDYSKMGNDVKCCTVVDVNTGKICSIKPSKVLIDAFAASNVVLPPSVITYCAEKFQQDWEAYQLRQKNRYTLVVDDDFQSIYSQHKCSGNFGSCMTGKKCFNFYSESVVAKSAKLLDAEAGNLIVARCVLYPEAVNAKGKVVRYADRQYSSNGADRLKSLLIDRLYSEGLIDAHKAVGAGCREPEYIVDKTGSRLEDPRLTITCTLKSGGYNTYMDTFKYYLPEKGIACTRVPNRYMGQIVELNRTDEHIRF